MPNDFKTQTQQAVTEAKQWAQQAVDNNVDLWVDVIQHAANNTYTADQLAKDVSRASLGAAQVSARMFSTMVNLGVAIVSLDTAP